MTTLNYDSLRTSFEGFEAILDIIHQCQPFEDNTLNIVFSDWIDANMCAPLGAAITHQKIVNDAHGALFIQKEKTKAALRKNGFLAQFGAEQLPDDYDTTIPYRQFGSDNASAEEFKRHIAESFRSGIKGLPIMTDPLLREFRTSIFEIYNNAAEHAESSLGVFTCGQYYPRKERLDFSIADLGLGIRRRILQSCRLAFEPEEAINWAASGNTTRTGPRPGGLGLKLLREFIALNKGCLLIVSDAGYWRQRGDQVKTQRFSRPFPGTVVTMEFNTADQATYCLQSEIDESQIF